LTPQERIEYGGEAVLVKKRGSAASGIHPVFRVDSSSPEKTIFGGCIRVAVSGRPRAAANSGTALRKIGPSPLRPL
jgi:hypothetical protein